MTEITSQLCRHVVQQASERNVLCPSNLRHGIPVIGALGNVDMNPTSVTSSSPGFHGTSISLFQPCSQENQGTPLRETVTYSSVECPGNRSVPDLTDFYDDVPCCILPTVKPSGPGISEGIGAIMVAAGMTSTLLVE